MVKNTLSTGFIALFVLALSLPIGCGGGVPPSYIHPNFDISFYQRIVVAPFENLTTQEFAASRVRQLLIAELLLVDAFEVVEPGEARRALIKVQPDRATSLSIEQIKKLGEELGAQGVIVGSVDAYEEHQFGGYTIPEITASFRMIDVESGAIVWSVTDTEGGLPLKTQLLGFRPQTMSEATQELVRRAIDSLFF